MKNYITQNDINKIGENYALVKNENIAYVNSEQYLSDIEVLVAILTQKDVEIELLKHMVDKAKKED